MAKRELLTVMATFAMVILWNSHVLAAFNSPDSVDRGSATLVELAEKIPGLEWIRDSLKVEYEEKNGKSIYFIRLKGSYSGTHTELLMDQQILAQGTGTPKDPEVFSLRVPITSKTTPVRLRAVDIRGNVYKAKVILKVKELEYKEASSAKWFNASASLGYSMINYQEGSTVEVAMAGLTAKGFLQVYLSPGKWDVAGSFFATVTQLSSTHPAAARFIGLNLRLGHTFPQIKAPWQVALLGGFYYTTMVVSQNAFGFRDMAGPQLFPTIRYVFNPKTSLGVYFKYSPILNNFTLLPFGQREMAVGLNFSRLLGNHHPVIASVDFADLKVIVDRVEISSVSTSFSIGYGF